MRMLDGLRGIAIADVVIGHFFARYLPSGYLGVDLFFLISGYIVSLGIFTKLQDKTFSFVSFYISRALRLLPGLAATLFFTLFCFYWLMTPAEYQELGRHLVNTVLFAGNLSLINKSDYFSFPSKFNPLLHTWSLGIEEQFYILFPPFAILGWQRKKLSTFRLSIITLTLLIVSLIWYRFYQTTYFYNPIPRFWIFFLGITLAYFECARTNIKKFFSPTKNFCRPAVATAALIGLLYIPFHDPFCRPSFYGSIIIAFTTSIILLLGHTSPFVCRFLTTPPLLSLGMSSYMIYLLYLPSAMLLKFLKGPQYFFSENNLFAIKAIAILGIVIVAFLWTHFIERPIRFTKSGQYALAFIVITLTIGIYGFVAEKELLSPRKSLIAEQVDSATVDFSRFSDPNVQQFGTDTHPNILAFGDSLMGHFHVYFQTLQTRHPEQSILFLSEAGCTYFDIDSDQSNTCPSINKLNELLIKQSFDEIYISADFIGTLGTHRSESNVIQSKFDSLFKKARAAAKMKVILIKQAPYGLMFNPKTTLERSFLKPVSANISPIFLSDLDARYFEQTNTILEIAKRNGVTVRDLSPLFCNQTVCYLQDAFNNFVYSDGKHFTRSFIESNFEQIHHILKAK